MEYALLAMTAQETPVIDANLAAGIADAARATGGPRWLQDNVACEFAITCRDADHAAGIVREVQRSIDGQRLDIAAVPQENRRKKLLLADMDSTIIGQECIDELGILTGLGDKIITITERAMRGELDFSQALRERVGLMKGLDANLIQRVIDERVTFNPGGRTLVQTMRAHGARTVLVSGGFSDFTTFVAAETGFDDTHANHLVIEDGKLAGRVEEPILGRSAKLETLHRYCSDLSLEASDAIAVGDGANDLDMLQGSGFGIAYRAKPVVARAADVSLVHADLTALLFVQGYCKHDFST